MRKLTASSSIWPMFKRYERIEEAISRLLLKSKPQTRFAVLAKYGLLDLSYEAIAVKYADRFDRAVVAAANARLAQYGFSPLPLASSA
jgi:hypothetical protein